MATLRAINGGAHDTRPDPSAIRAEATGEPVSLLAATPLDYPLAAVCAGCGGPIRLASVSVLAEWQHAGPP